MDVIARRVVANVPRPFRFYVQHTQMYATEKIKLRISKKVLIDTLKNGHFSLFIMRKQFNQEVLEEDGICYLCPSFVKTIWRHYVQT